MTRIQALTTLTAIVDELNGDEIEVLARFAAKIRNGSRKHGPMCLDADTRHWQREIQAERADAACYGYMEEIQEERRKAAAASAGVNGIGSVDPIVAGLRELAQYGADE